MKTLLDDYIFSDSLCYQAHKMIYKRKFIRSRPKRRTPDKNHPRFMELYHRWRAQLSDPEPYKQFHGFVRAVMMHEQ